MTPRPRPGHLLAPAALAVLLAACGDAPRRAEAAPADPARTAAGDLSSPTRSFTARTAAAMGSTAASASGAGWSAPRAAAALSDALGRRGRNGLAAVAMDGAGVLHAVFGVDRDGDRRADALEYARLDGGAWSPPQEVVATLDLADPAAVAVDGDGDVHVLWYGHSGGLSTRTTPTDVMQRVLRGGRWSPPRVLYHETARSGMHVRWLAAATDARGDVQLLFAPEGRGLGNITLRSERVGAPTFLDHDGNMMAFSASVPGAPLEVAYIGEQVSREHPRADNDVFVRSLSPGAGWSEARGAYQNPGRFSHYPQVVVDSRGVRHLFWLEDTDGSVQPEAVYASTSREGATWSPPVDVTPAEVRGGVPMRLSAVADASDRIHLLVHYATAERRMQLAYLRIDGGKPVVERTLAAAGQVGPGEAQLAYDRQHGRVLAVWRGADGVYRWSELPAR